MSDWDENAPQSGEIPSADEMDFVRRRKKFGPQTKFISTTVVQKFHRSGTTVPAQWYFRGTAWCRRLRHKGRERLAAGLTDGIRAWFRCLSRCTPSAH